MANAEDVEEEITKFLNDLHISTNYLEKENKKEGRSSELINARIENAKRRATSVFGSGRKGRKKIALEKIFGKRNNMEETNVINQPELPEPGPQEVNEEDEDGPEDTIAADLAATGVPTLTSKLLNKYKTLPVSVLTLFDAYNRRLAMKRKSNSKRRPREVDWIIDYVNNQKNLEKIVSQHEALISNNDIGQEDSSESEEDVYQKLDDLNINDTRAGQSRRNPTLPNRNHTFFQNSTQWPTRDETIIPPLDKNRLFLQPEQFLGDTKKAREWIEEYETAALSNNWSEAQKCKYFPSFLFDSARTWFRTMATKNDEHKIWTSLKEMFLEFYLGSDNMYNVQRQLENCFQEENESIVQFIPRILIFMQQVEPDKPEKQVVSTIKSRLRSHYQKQLAAINLQTLKDLGDICLRLEESQTQIKLVSMREKPKKDHSPTPITRNAKLGFKAKNKPRSDQHPNRKRLMRTTKQTKGGDNSDIKCYRCDRQGHYATSCKFNSKANGEPVNERKNKKNINMIETQVAPDSKRPLLNQQHLQPQIIASVRNAGHSQVLAIMLCTSSSNQLLEKEVLVNGTPIRAVIDTGARVSVIDQDLVKRYNWNINHSAMGLMGPSGASLDCSGVIVAKVECCVGKFTMNAKVDLAVVKNLCVQMLLGFDLIKSLKIVINLSAERPISFDRSARLGGARLEEEVTLPPRSINMVRVKVLTESEIICTRPYQIDNSILLANSIDRVENNVCRIMLANIDNRAICLRKNQQVASIEPFDESKEKLDHNKMINNIWKLETSDEIVHVGDNLSPNELTELGKMLDKHKDAFSIKGELGKTDITTHKIFLKDDAKPIAEPLRRRPKIHIDETRRQIQEMLNNDVIEPSTSPWAAAYVVVKKKSGEWRICVDFRGLNAQTKMDAYPLPLIENCIESIANNKFFSLLDFHSGYWQIPMADESKELTAFRTEDGLWQFKRMPFGLCTAPASFQRLMNGLFAGMSGMNLQIFIDDVCLASKSFGEHLKLLDKTLALVKNSKLKLKSSKCVFAARQIVFLGHQINEHGISADPAKLRAIAELPTPTDVTSVRRVVGLFSYYRKFVENFAMISEPLTRLTRKSQKFEWTKEQANAFGKLKDELAKRATLAHLNGNDPILLKTDASRVGVAAILLQQHNQHWKLVSCCSRRLTKAETNYGITDLEALAIIYAVCKLRHYLLGRHFTIMTDHHALCVLTSKTPQSARLQRWALILSEYSYTIVYTKGTAHRDVDCLSRAPVDNHDEYVDKILLVASPIDPNDWVRHYADDESENFLQLAVNKSDEFELRGKLIYKQNRLFVPKSKRLRMLQESHDSPIAGHDGIEGTFNRMKSVWWPKMRNTIKNYVKSCEVCMKRKSERLRPKGLMRQHNSKFPLEKISIDYVGPLPESVSGKRFVCVAVDVCTKFVVLKAMKDQTTTKFTKFLAELCCNFGVPRSIVTDNAKCFTSTDAKQLTSSLNIKHIFAAPRHSQGNAPAERMIQSVCEKMAMILQDETLGFDWEKTIPFVQLSINTKISKSTMFSPYELMFARKHNFVQPMLTSEHVVYDSEIAELVNNDSIHAANANTTKQHCLNKKHYDEKRVPHNFKVGEQVLVERSDRRQKLSNRFEGPFRVTDIKNDIITVSNMAKQETRIKHASQLKPFIERVLFLSTLLMKSNELNSQMTTSAVHWERVNDRYVSLGTEYREMQIFYVCPCDILLRLQNLMAIEPLKYKFNFNPAMHLHEAERHQKNAAAANAKTEIKTGNNAIPRVQRTTYIDAALKECRNSCVDFMFSVRRFNYTTPAAERPKRQLGAGMALGAAGYYYFSNMLSNIKHKYFPEEEPEDNEQENAKFFEEVDMSLRKLNEREDVQQLINQFVNTELRHTQEWLQVLTDKVNYLIRAAPEVAAITALLINRIREKKAILDRLHTSMWIGDVDKIALTQTVTREFYGNIKITDAKLKTFVATTNQHQQESLFVQASGPTESMDTGVYKVNALNYITRERESLVLKEYIGRPWLIRNETSDCVMGIEPDFDKYIKTSCVKPHYRDPALKLWRKTNITKEMAPPTSWYEAWPHMVIQCWPHNLTIFKPIDKTIRCPMRPISLNATWSFSTSDGLLNHTGLTQGEVRDRIVNMDLHVVDTHSDEDINEEIHKEDVIDYLIKEKDKISMENLWVNNDQFKITHRTGHFTAWSTFVIFASIIAIAAIIQHCHIEPSRRSEDLRRRALAVEEIYGTRLQQLRTRLNSRIA